MKLLFLSLAILLAMEPAMPGECWLHGHCRLVCRDGEDHVIRCHNRKRCCVPERYLTIQPVTIDGRLDWTTPHVTKNGHKRNKNRNRG
ncbi:beta-defensin 36-like [Lepus europaeus]|uniref:beta-defensin 36-like n=1 Tax=Lepus europaeus TaxID=9983 RepID=UPI002B45E9AA|nr:beta-defensin 36-like [Lepus europaeus]